MPKMTANTFRMIYFRKNASATPLDSYTFKTKDLKPFRLIYLQKTGGWEGVGSRLGLPATDARGNGGVMTQPPLYVLAGGIYVTLPAVRIFPRQAHE